MGTGVTRQRLWNLLPLGGARGDVMNGHWCDQADIMESIAVWGHPRGCYVMNGCGLVRPGRDYGMYRRSGAPEGILCYEWTWLGVTRPIAESIAARGHPRGCYEVMNGCGLVQPGRLQNLSLLRGARGDVMTGLV